MRAQDDISRSRRLKSITSCSLCQNIESNSMVVLQSTICGHRVCASCFLGVKRSHERGVELASYGIMVGEQSNEGVMTESSLRCPKCECRYPREKWVNRRQQEQSYLASTKYRRRVFAVLNKHRSLFSTTPEYDDYLEQREAMALRFDKEGLSPPDMRKLQDELKDLEQRQHELILECQAQAEETDRASVKSIVEREGVFYQVIGSNLRLGFDSSEGTANLQHPLLGGAAEGDETGLFGGRTVTANLPSPIDGTSMIANALKPPPPGGPREMEFEARQKIYEFRQNKIENKDFEKQQKGGGLQQETLVNKMLRRSVFMGLLFATEGGVFAVKQE